VKFVSTLEREAAGFSEIMVPAHQPTQWHNPACSNIKLLIICEAIICEGSANFVCTPQFLSYLLQHENEWYNKLLINKANSELRAWEGI
jgi:hypothetical protein